MTRCSGIKDRPGTARPARVEPLSGTSHRRGTPTKKREVLQACRPPGSENDRCQRTTLPGTHPLENPDTHRAEGRSGNLPREVPGGLQVHPGRQRRTLPPSVLRVSPWGPQREWTVPPVPASGPWHVLSALALPPSPVSVLAPRFARPTPGAPPPAPVPFPRLSHPTLAHTLGLTPYVDTPGPAWLLLTRLGLTLACPAPGLLEHTVTVGAASVEDQAGSPGVLSGWPRYRSSGWVGSAPGGAGALGAIAVAHRHRVASGRGCPRSPGKPVRCRCLSTPSALQQ